jgi:hypothetical protein
MVDGCSRWAITAGRVSRSHAIRVNQRRSMTSSEIAAHQTNIHPSSNHPNVPSQLPLRGVKYPPSTHISISPKSRLRAPTSRGSLETACMYVRMSGGMYMYKSTTAGFVPRAGNVEKKRRLAARSSKLEACSLQLAARPGGGRGSKSGRDDDGPPKSSTTVSFCGGGGFGVLQVQHGGLHRFALPVPSVVLAP